MIFLIIFRKGGSESMGKAIIHVDMDAFYASVEQRDNPELLGRPVIIGGTSGRGVVSAASYEARRYGIHSAMSVQVAKRLCPDGTYLRPNMNKYKETSREIHKRLRRYSDAIEPISIDEAFLDVSGKDPVKIAKNIKEDIEKELKLTASIGISINKFVAKLASDIEKPNGLTIIKEKEIIDFLRPLPIDNIWGVGPKMEREMNKLGIYYIKDIQDYDKEVLESIFGKRGRELYDFSYGRDNRPVEEDVLNQSIGEEETFREDVENLDFLTGKLKEYSKNLSKKLIKRSYLIRTITIKIKYNDFTIETRSITLGIPTDNSNVIFDTGKYILENKFELKKSVRLIGLTGSNLIYPDDPHQLAMKI